MRHFYLLICLFWMAELPAQVSTIWFDKEEATIRRDLQRDIIPDVYRTVEAIPGALRARLDLAPDEAQIPPSRSPVVLEVPAPDGTFERFRIVRYRMMEEGLSARYPEVATYRGVHVDNPWRTIRLAWTARGFSAMVSGGGNKYFIDPYARRNQSDYISYYKSDYTGPERDFRCLTQSAGERPVPSPGQRSSGDCTFRSYRLAVAATGEYSNFHDATGPADSDTVLAAIVITINRVNEVYERDVAIRLILIANTDDVFYYNAGSDPYSGTACNMLPQNQTTMDNVIGSANYDIGHVFTAVGGGCASLQVPCTGNKARGATGLNPPIGDPFYIDYVAHEIGHQFGGNHCFNNSCNNNRNNATAYEPGSGATIMAYAGICSPNVQSNSDDYFHGISVFEINDFTAFDDGDICDDPILPWNNNAPVVTPGADYTIPISTPFMLTAVATDADGDPLNYLWEQWDQEIGSMPPSSSNTVGPMFRSFDPDTSPTRFFPRLADLVNNVSPTWEVLPSVTRNMDFRVTVKDFHNGMAGCADEDNINVNTTAAAGPFLVLGPNTSTVAWTEGQNETVTWDVAGTDASPVNCANVDILLSYDGGFTWDDTVATSLPNTGSASVIVPAGVTTMARVMVKCSDNVFFDISDEDFEILSGLPDYNLASVPPSQAVCQPNSASFTIEVGSVNGYSDAVTLSLSGHPAGSSIAFSVNPVIPGNTSTLTISGLGGVTPGDYPLILSGSSTTGPKDIAIGLQVLNTPAGTMLELPADGAIEVDLQPLFEWEADAVATAYDIQVSSDSGFVSLAVDTTVADTFLTSPVALDPVATYYWRVRPTNLCGNGAWSAVFGFETVPCLIYVSTDVPKTIPSSPGNVTITSVVEILDSGVITDVNVLDLEGTHTWIDDLDVTLISPAATSVELFSDICGSNNDFDLDLDDEAPNSTFDCPPTTGLAYQPEGMLSDFDGEQLTGTWTLQIVDDFNQDGGTLDHWSIQVCLSDYSCNKEVFNTNDDGPGSLRAAVACASDGDTITFNASVHNETIILGSPLVIDEDIYFKSDISELVTVSGVGLTRPFEIQSSAAVEMSGFKILAGLGPDGAGILNQGTLFLRDMTILPAVSPPVTSLVSNSGTLTIEGNCSIEP